MLVPTKSRKSLFLSIPALVILVTVWLFPVSVFSGTYIICPTADAGVVSWVPDGAFGTDISVYVEQLGFSPELNYTYAYFKFDLSSIPKGQTITGGALYAYCNYVNGFPASCQLRAVSDNS